MAFTRVAARMVAEPPNGDPCRRSASGDVVASIVRSDCYRLERTVAGRDSHPLRNSAFARRTTNLTCAPRPVVACAGGEDMVQSAALGCIKIKSPSGAGKTEIPAQRRTERNGDSGRRRDRDAAL